MDRCCCNFERYVRIIERTYFLYIREWLRYVFHHKWIGKVSGWLLEAFASHLSRQSTLRLTHPMPTTYSSDSSICMNWHSHCAPLKSRAPQLIFNLATR